MSMARDRRVNHGAVDLTAVSLGGFLGRRDDASPIHQCPLCSTSGHSITAHSANLKKTSRSLTINQCSGGSFLRGQYRQLLPDRRSTPTLDGYYVGKGGF